MKKLALNLTILVAPFLLGSIGSVQAATTNAQADEAVQTQTWTDTKTNQRIHTKNLIGMPVYDQYGVIQERQLINPDTDYHVTSIRTSNQTGEIFYQIGTDQYIISDDVVGDTPDTVISDGEFVVHTLDKDNIPLYNGDLKPVANEKLAGDSLWYTNKQIDDRDNGSTYFLVSTDRYVSSADIDQVSGVQK
ncbi:hypothetical protein [Companilactobacillus furfuricola]|uniref:hypothetical protein n=1 Tax=Companilactobacillus furfuricola TaxID=1462575 RepID=UPI000F79C811|nr:hypothetical protein [Companilactobacillus furfuricola]